MEIYYSVHNILAWSITVAVLGFVTFPWGILAYKIWHGNKPIDEELSEELLWRSFYAGWPTALVAMLFLFLDYVTADKEWLDLPAGPVHLVYFVGFLSLVSGWMMYCFSLEDFFQGFILTIIYLYLPMAVLWAFSKLFDNPLLKYVLTWLPRPEG